MRRVILTGAPGCGKTTLLQGLRAPGRAVVDEAATDVIAEQQARGVAEPWLRDDFPELVAALQRDREMAPVAPGTDVQLFDRSPLCTLALARHLRHEVGPVLRSQVQRVARERVYEREVLFVRPLGFVVRTAARRIGYQESLDFEAVHEAVYREHDFVLVDVPAASSHERVAVVDDHLRRS